MTPYERGRMVQGNCDGLSIHEIGRQLNRPYETIKSSLKVIPVRKDGESLPRNGAPSLLKGRQTPAILHTVYRTPKVSYKDLLTQVGLGPRNQYTVYRCLKEHGSMGSQTGVVRSAHSSHRVLQRYAVLGRRHCTPCLVRIHIYLTTSVGAMNVLYINKEAL